MQCILSTHEPYNLGWEARLHGEPPPPGREPWASLLEWASRRVAGEWFR